jgi:hypothetical protein
VSTLKTLGVGALALFGGFTGSEIGTKHETVPEYRSPPPIVVVIETAQSDRAAHVKVVGASQSTVEEDKEFEEAASKFAEQLGEYFLQAVEHREPHVRKDTVEQFPVTPTPSPTPIRERRP